MSNVTGSLLILSFLFVPSAWAESGVLSDYEMEEIFEDVNRPETAGRSTGSLAEDDAEAAAEVNSLVGDSLTESNSFQSYRPEPRVTRERFVRGDQPAKKIHTKKVHSKKAYKKKHKKAYKKATKPNKKRDTASVRKHRNKRYR